MATRYVPRPPVDDYSRNGPSNVSAPLLAQLAAFPVAKPPYWKYHYDDAAFWQGKPNQAIPPLGMPPGGNYPIKPPYWKYHYDDSAFWQGEPTPLPPITLPANGGYPIRPSFVGMNNYDDSAFWQARPVPPNEILNFYPVPVAPAHRPALFLAEHSGYPATIWLGS